MKNALAAMKIVISELALFLALTMAGFVVVGILNIAFGFGSVDASLVIGIRNAVISLTFLAVYHQVKLSPDSLGQVFTRRIWKRLSGAAIVLTLLWGMFQVFSTLFLWSSRYVDQDEDLISQFIIFAFPPLYMGLRWLEKRAIMFSDDDYDTPSSIIQHSQIQSTLPERYSLDAIPTLGKILIAMSLIFTVLFYFNFLGTYFFVLASISGVTALVILWKFIPWLMKRVLPALLVSRTSILRKVVSALIGVPTRFEARFYLEAEVDRTSIQKMIKSRVPEFLLTSLAVTFVLGRSYLTQLVQRPVTDEFLHIISVVEVMIFAPILAAFIVAPIWMVEDAQVRFINNRQVSGKLDDQLRGGGLNRVIGIVGFVSGIDFTVELFRLYPQLSAANGAWDNDFVLYLDAFVTLLFISIFLVPIVYAISIIYLTNLHEAETNSLRENLGKKVAFCNTIAVQIEEARINSTTVQS